MAAPQRWSHDGSWPACRPHPRYVGIGLLLASAALLAVGTLSEDRLVLIGEAIGFVLCLGVTMTARVHLRAQVPLSGRHPDGRLVLITEGPGVQTLMRWTRDPYAALHRDISFTYLLVPAVLLPISVLLIVGAIYGYEGVSVGTFYGLVSGLGLVLAWRGLHATWWALRSGGTILNPKVTSPVLAAYADLHGEHTVSRGVRDQDLRAMLAEHPEVAANVAEVSRFLGADATSSPGDAPDPSSQTSNQEGQRAEDAGLGDDPVGKGQANGQPHWGPPSSQTAGVQPRGPQQPGGPTRWNQPPAQPGPIHPGSGQRGPGQAGPNPAGPNPTGPRQAGWSQSNR